MSPVLTRLDRGNGWRLFVACPLHLPATFATPRSPQGAASQDRHSAKGSPLPLCRSTLSQTHLRERLTGRLPRAYQGRGKGRGKGLGGLEWARDGEQVQHDYAELEQALGAFVAPGEVFELRLLHNGRKRIDSGYFDHPAHAATAIAALQEPYAGIYFTPNPVNPDIAARSYNRIAPWASITTLDGDVLERRWLLVDIDPDRPAGISSTDIERASALKLANTIANSLELEGWPRPYINSSGNGAHLMYGFKEPNNEFVRDETARFLKLLNARFKANGCSVDTTVFNAARIWRVPGTWSRKGDSTPNRPHRKATILDRPAGNTNYVSLAQVCQYNQRNSHRLAAVVSSTKGATSALPADEKKYRALNEQAMNRLKEWVPQFFPAAREYKSGYRVTSADMGLDYEEDLTIHPWPLGIKYFGISDQGDASEGRRYPVGLIAEFCTLGDKDLAARKLADVLQAPLTEFTDIVPARAKSLPGIETTRAGYDFTRVPSMADLQQRSFKTRNWIIPDVLPTGNILLAARPKMRKTFLALQLAIAVSGGRKFLDWQCTQGDVLFLGLEDNERRLKERIKLLQTFELNPPDLSGFRYWTGGVDISPTTGKSFVSDPEEAARTYAAFPRGEGGVDALKGFLDVFPKTKLIIIDTYAHFRDQSNNRDVYQRDYDQMMPITRLAAEREICIMVVHHEKKGLASQDSGDFMEDVSGTSGITGAVDGVVSIKGTRGVQHENEQRKLLISGRDIPRDFAVDMSFDAQKGGWQTAAKQDVQKTILELLARHPFINQNEFISLLPNTTRARISQVLTNMKYEGLVIQSKFGYSLPRELQGVM